MFFQDIHLISALAAALIGTGIGFLWYASWLFGPGSVPFKVRTGSAIFSFFAAFVLASLFNSIVVLSIGDILLTGFIMWIGFSAPAAILGFVRGTGSHKALLADFGYMLVAVEIMALVIGLFS